MSWDIDLEARTATRSGCAVRFHALPTGGVMGSDCFRDVDGVLWRGKFAPLSAHISNEAERMRTLHESVDAYCKAVRKSIDPFPTE